MNPTLYAVILATIVLAYYLNRVNRAKKGAAEAETGIKPEQKAKEQLDIRNSYQSRSLLSLNERSSFWQLKAITDQMNMMLFAKVRLYDLVEPRRGVKKFKTLQYKIQAKHVDFVVCNDSLFATHIIELDDSTHDRQDRKERDQFVDEVLESTGYKILHIRAVDPERVKTFLKS